MAYTDINSEDRLVQKTFADHLRDKLGWESIYAYNDETFGPNGTLGRTDTRDVVLTRDLRMALGRLNPLLPPAAIGDAVANITRYDFSRSLLQHNQEYYRFIRDGVPVTYRDAQGALRHALARVIDFQNENGADGKPNNRFLAVRELKITGLRAPSYNRRADLVCFINGLWRSACINTSGSKARQEVKADEALSATHCILPKCRISFAKSGAPQPAPRNYDSVPNREQSSQPHHG